MIKNVIAFMMICVINAFNASAQVNKDPNFHLYILIGQSNMAGRGPITPELQNESNPRVLTFNKANEWVLAKHPLHFDKPDVVAVGPGLAFGIKMAEANPGAKIGLIPCAVGGSPIEHWAVGAYDEATKTHPYDDAVVRIKEAMKYGVVKGVIWHQGESNSSPEQVKKYMEQLTELIDRVRQLVNDQELPFIAGELGRFDKKFDPFNQEIAKLRLAVPYTGLASSQGLVHKGDMLHFDGASAEELGKRYAAEMIRVQKKLGK